MTDDKSGSEITRRSMLRRTGGAAGAGIGLAMTINSAQAGCKDHPCPTCDEEKGGPTRYLIAHRPPGNPDNCQQLCLPEPAAEAHLEQHPDDECGMCPDDDGNNVNKGKSGKSGKSGKGGKSGKSGKSGKGGKSGKSGKNAA